ncbi:MFS transporter [Pseudonocardia sp. GCM10023141]|uniref:MFS transporter n=1 Tax=Pseudonocardia sp. GCM10023141 TaxID=3252653 RepID=UPI003614B540
MAAAGAGRAQRAARPAATVAVGTLATGLGAYLGFVPGFLAPVLQSDLDLTRTQIGVLVGVFYGATGVGSPFAGRVADRIGGRRAITLDLLLVAATLAVSALAPGYGVLLACAATAGFGYALTNAGTNIAVAVAVPRHRHGVALATKTAGVPLLVAVSAPVATAAGVAAGWQPVYLGTAVIVLAVAVCAAVVLPDGRTRRGSPSARTLPRRFGWFPIAAFLLIAGSQPLYSWVVACLHEAGGLSLTLAGAFTACGSLAGIGGMVLAARRSDRAAAASRIPAIVGLCLVTFGGEGLLLAGVFTGPVPMVAGLVVATVAQLSAVGIMHAAVVAAAPHAVGRASGVTMAGYYAGALIGAPVFGAIVDATGGYGLAWTISAVLVLGGAAAFARCRRVGETVSPAATAGGADGAAATIPPRSA